MKVIKNNASRTQERHCQSCGSVLLVEVSDVIWLTLGGHSKEGRFQCPCYAAWNQIYNANY